MSLKEVTRAGQSGGRKAAVREEQLPSQHPLPKPTRDVSASNRSHSLTHEDPPVFPSHRRLLLVDREAEQAQLEKQANVVYTRQFRTLAKLLGNDSMDFEQLREKVEGLVLADRPAHDQQLLQRIRTLEWQLSRKVTEIRSSQSLPTSQEYLRGLETQLGRKNKIISELSDSVKRQAFEEMIKGFQLEVEAKNAALKEAEEQNQQMRLRSNAKVSTLEEELIRHKQTIQKLTFQLDSQKRRAQTLSEDLERLKKREKDLLNSYENEGKATYKGLSYSSNGLLMQLEARDQELSTSLAQHNFFQQEINSLRRQQLQFQEQYRQLQLEAQAVQTKLQFQEGQRQRLLQEIQQVTRQLRLSNQAVASANQAQQALLSEKDRTERELREKGKKLQQMEIKLTQFQLKPDNLHRKMVQYEEQTINLRMNMQQVKREATETTNLLNHLQQRNQLLQKQLGQWNSAKHDHQENLLLKQRELQQLRSEMALREEEHIRREGEFSRRQVQFSHREQEFTRRQIEFIRKDKQNLLKQHKFSIERLQFIRKQEEYKRLQALLQQKEKQILTLDQRIQAFEQEKELLMHRLDIAEQEQARMGQRQRHFEEMPRGRPALEDELNTRKIQEHNSKILLEEAAEKEALLQAEIQQKQIQLREIQQERKREQNQYQKQVYEIGRLLEQSQEQLQHQKQRYEGRLQDQIHLRQDTQQQTKQLRVTLGELQERHKDQIKGIMQHLDRVQLQQRELIKRYQIETTQLEQLLRKNQQLRIYNQQLTAVIQQHGSQTLARKAREVDIEKQFHQEVKRYQTEINQLRYIIQELKTEKTEVQRQLESMKNSRPKENQLSSFTFNHYEPQHQVAPSSPDLNAIIQQLQHKLDSYKRDQEQRIRLSYSNNFEASPALFASLASEKEQLYSENRRLEQQLIMQHEQSSQKEAELLGIHKDLETLRTKLVDYEQMLQKYEATINKLNNQLTQQTAFTQQGHQQNIHFQQTQQEREEQHIKLREKYEQHIGRVQKQETELISIRLQLQRMKQARQVHSVAAQSQRRKGQLTKTSEQIIKLRAEITSTFKQLQMAKQQVGFQRKQATQSKLRAEQYQMRVVEYQHRVSELQQRPKRQASQQTHRMVSGISKRSNISQQQLEERRSKGSSDGQLSRRILNDPSKISGQSSKFAHHLLVFENSKIHVTREPAAQIAAEKQIKQQRQEQSVLSKQQQQNKPPESSHRNTLTHFDRHSNDNTRRDARESQHNFSESKGSQRQSMPQSNHSLNSIRQAEMVQQGSVQPARPSSVSSIQKQIQNKPKQYLPQHSSKKTMSPMESKQNIANRNQSRPSVGYSQQKRSISNHEQKQEISNIESKQSIGPQEAPPQPISFHRNSYQTTVPIYIARPSALQPQQTRQNSHSQSGSKTKVRISYGQATDKSIEIIKKEGPKEMRSSHISRASIQNNIIEGSINQVSPINERSQNPQYNSPSLYSSQHKEAQQQRASIHNNSQIEPPGDSIINVISQMTSRIPHLTPRISNASELPRYNILRRESSPVYIQPRIEIAHSPRHSNVISFNPARSSNQVAPIHQQIKLEPIVRQQPKKEETTVPPSKIVMRSVIGGKRNSLLNETPTFGKYSQKGHLNQTISQSNDSGIDVLQMDWMTPCCKNN